MSKNNNSVLKICIIFLVIFSVLFCVHYSNMLFNTSGNIKQQESVGDINSEVNRSLVEDDSVLLNNRHIKGIKLKSLIALYEKRRIAFLVQPRGMYNSELGESQYKNVGALLSVTGENFIVNLSDIKDGGINNFSSNLADPLKWNDADNKIGEHINDSDMYYTVLIKDKEGVITGVLCTAEVNIKQ